MAHVTVVIPTYNRKDFLEQAVETVRVQTYDSVDCVVVDDGSTDGTREYLEGLDYDALRTVFHEDNCGQSVARNTGIDNASSEYVLFLDSDDILYPHAAETLVSAIENQADDCAGAFASTKHINSRGRVTIKSVPEKLLKEATVENTGYIGGLSCTMFRRDALEEIGGFDESLSRRDDFDLYMRFLKQYTLLGVDEVCCERRLHEDGISNDAEEIEKSHQKLVEKHQLDESQPD
jgi:glycosyltransferase involved in cell wall biosynthesis